MLRRRCEDTFVDSREGKGKKIRREEHHAQAEFFYHSSFLLMKSVSTTHMPRVHAEDDPQPFEVLIL
jgi:hypothetical protein